MDQLSDIELIKNFTLFHAYFCHLIENGQADSAEDLCEISFQLSEEISKRKITEFQIEKCIKNANFDPQDHLMVYTYIYPQTEDLNAIIAES